MPEDEELLEDELEELLEEELLEDELDELDELLDEELLDDELDELLEEELLEDELDELLEEEPPTAPELPKDSSSLPPQAAREITHIAAIVLVKLFMCIPIVILEKIRKT